MGGGRFLRELEGKPEEVVVVPDPSSGRQSTSGAVWNPAEDLQTLRFFTKEPFPLAGGLEILDRNHIAASPSADGGV